MCPYGGRLFTGGNEPVYTKGELVVHALLVETGRDLVLVDTGMGLDDVRTPSRRLGVGFVAGCRPILREEETAARQVERLGFKIDDVTHVVVTHLDVDHAGGISDFAKAKIHVMKTEHEAAMARASLHEKQRYRKVHFAGDPKWELHETGGEKWFGFESVRAVADDVLMIPLPGHTRGHAAIAVRTPAGYEPGGRTEWLLHCGDAYFFHGEMVEPPTCPKGLAWFQKFIAMDDKKRRANQQRLRELRRDHGARVRVFSAHCPKEFRKLMGAQSGRHSREIPVEKLA